MKELLVLQNVVNRNNYAENLFQTMLQLPSFVQNSSRPERSRKLVTSLVFLLSAQIRLAEV